MTKSIDFYFDFISPYSYLAYKKIDKLGEVNINYKPILLGGLHKLGGITAPAFNERKMKNMKNDCELIALKNGIEFVWNIKFPINSLYLMRGYLVVKKEIKPIFFDKYSHVINTSIHKLYIKKKYEEKYDLDIKFIKKLN